jgi:nucleoside-diphosphate-sugar epimerase
MKKHILAKENILITGSDGFVGKHLFNALEQVGARPLGIRRLKEITRGNIYSVDVLDYNALEKFITNPKSFFF